MSKVTLLQGDCLQKLKELKDNSVDSVVTDPPYGIGFMGKAWDTFDTKNVKKANEEATKSYQKTKEEKVKNNPNLKGRKNAPIGGKATFAGTYDLSPSGTLAYQKFCEEWGRECFRVLKPGGHLLSSCSPRMYHRMTVGLEDAGFEIRDQILWVYGSGFPKSHNIGKAVDKLQGNEREFVGLGASQPAKSGHFAGSTADSINYTEDKSRYNPPVTKGNSEWEGWGTALKPAHEPIVMARKPFKGSVANNVLEWGTGGINIDGCRIGNEPIQVNVDYKDEKQSDMGWGTKKAITEIKEQGRFPANIIFDEEAGKILDEQSGITKGGKNMPPYQKPIDNNVRMNSSKQINRIGYEDLGGASRFFYCPKASKRDRNEGCDELESKSIKGRDEGQDKTSIAYKSRPTERQNIHPTVKPTDLMAYLVRLVTPKGGVVLDPFMGSGSTGKAAVREGMDFIGIEREDEYMKIAKARIEHEQKKHKIRDFI